MFVYHNLDIDIAYSLNSYWSLFKSYVPGGKALFTNTFKVKEKGGIDCPGRKRAPGQIIQYELAPNSKSVIIRPGALLASTPNVSLTYRIC